jgi:phenylpropionate dioxygenase-like ring-hydroxylating dioxygenase large terminal subunit
MALPDYSNEALSERIQAGRVHRSVYTDPVIFELEMERIFGKAWLYIGHESQVARPGDYFVTEMAGQSVILVRHRDERIHVLFNRCAHRGAIVVATPSGNARSFVCAYHSWSYATDGSLQRIPVRVVANAVANTVADAVANAATEKLASAVTDATPDMTASEVATQGPCEHRGYDCGLPKVPRVQIYKGFVFASLSPEGADLETSLGGLLRRIDDMVELAPEGELEVAGGGFQLVQASNWKLYLENMHDGQHPLSVHRSSVEASRNASRQLGDLPGSAFALKLLMGNAQTLAQMEKLAVVTLPGGHSYMAGFRDPQGDDAVFKEYAERLAEAKGKPEAQRILATNCHNAVFYPNASAMPSFLQMRVIFPVSVDRTRVESWSFRLKGAPAALHERTIAYANTVNSPSSLIRPDDVELYARVQRGVRSQGAEWICVDQDLDRDADPASSATDPEGQVSTAISDASIRNQYRAWLQYMTRSAA